MSRNGPEQRTGRVKKWSKNKGFGFIQNPEGEDVFVHYSAVPGPPEDKNLMVGDVVTYYEGERDKGLYAVKVLEVRRS